MQCCNLCTNFVYKVEINNFQPMKLKTFLFAITLVAAFSSCKSSRNVSTGKEAYTPQMQKMMTGYPEITGFERRAIFLDKLSPAVENQQKIEIMFI